MKSENQNIQSFGFRQFYSNNADDRVEVHLSDEVSFYSQKRMHLWFRKCINRIATLRSAWLQANMANYGTSLYSNNVIFIFITTELKHKAPVIKNIVHAQCNFSLTPSFSYIINICSQLSPNKDFPPQAKRKNISFRPWVHSFVQIQRSILRVFAI